jgi:hypothetical protein
MDERENRVSLKIDLTTGTIELVAPAENFNEAIEKTKELAATLDLQAGARPKPHGVSPPPPSEAPLGNGGEQASAQVNRPRAKPGKSGARVGRLGSYEPVPQLLTDEQQMALMTFMSEKAPVDQADRALVAMVKGEELLGRRGFVYNEIYTLMWLGGVKDLPKALDVVLGKMIQDQWVIREGAGFAVKFIGRNRVENELPRRDSN